MQRRVPKFARVRAGIASLFAAGALLAACQAELPTAVDIDQMDVAAAETRARATGSIARADSVVYIVEGQRVSKEEAYKLRPADIAMIDVVGAKTAGENIIEVHRVDGVRRMPPKGDEDVGVRIVGKLNAANPPMFLIDGKRSSADDFKKIDRENIESVSIVKGAAAIKEFGADAANGVITVRTKSGGAK